MDAVSLLGSAAIAVVLLVPFTRYCLVDSDRPNASIPWAAFLITHSLLSGTATFAFYAFRAQSVYAEASLLLFMGMVVGASAVDPNNMERKDDEAWKAYFVRYVAERIRRVALLKTVVVVTALLAPIIIPEYWYMLLILLVLHLHYYKMSNCITSEAGTVKPQLAPKAIQRKWQIQAVTAAIVMIITLKLPISYFQEVEYIPKLWSYFGGYTLLTGIAVLVSIFVRSADA